MIETSEVSYEADGLTMTARLARPGGVGPWPAVVIGHDGIGLHPYQRDRATSLAEQGYLALAMDYHGGGRLFSGDPEGMLARVMPLIADPDRMARIGHAAVRALLAVPGADPDRLAAVGYGAGANIVLATARSGIAFKAIAVVHPGLPIAGPADWTDLVGPVLLSTGSDDPICSPEKILAFGHELQDAGVDWRLGIYGGAKHAFWAAPVNPDGSSTGGLTHTEPTVAGVGHHPKHTPRGWRAVLDLLDETIGNPSAVTT